MAGPTTLLEAFQQLARRQPDRPFLEWGGSPPSMLTYAGASAESDLAACQLAQLSAGAAGWAGRKLAILSENSPRYILSLVAAWKLGAVPVLLPRGLSPGMLLAASRIARVDVVCHSPALADKAVGLARELGIEAHQLPQAAAASPATSMAPSTKDASERISSLPPLRPSDAAVILMTSSAVSAESIKLVRLSHANVCANMSAQLQHWRNLRRQRHLALMPIDHVLALSVDLCTLTLGTGGTYVLPDSDSLAQCMRGPQHLLHLLHLHRPTSITSAPFLLDAVASSSASSSAQALELLRSLEVALVGGAPPSDGLLLWANRKRIKLFNGFGSTECSGAMLYSPSMAQLPITDDAATLRVFKLLSCFHGDLKPVQGLRIDAGELVLSGPGISEGYLDRPDAAFRSLAQGTRAFETGSIFQRREDGLWSGGERVEDLVLFRTGEKCQPGDIVRLLEALSPVRKAVVLGNRQGEASDMLVAVVEVAPDHSEHDAVLAIQLANARLPSFARLARQQILFPNAPLPMTRKGSISSKEIWRLYGDDIAKACARILHHGAASDMDTPPSTPEEDVAVSRFPEIGDYDTVTTVRAAVRDVLALEPASALRDDESLVGLGLTSVAAARIVSLLGRRGQQVTAAEVIAADSVQAIASTMGTRASAQPRTVAQEQIRQAAVPAQQRSAEVALRGLSFRLPHYGSSEPALWQAFLDGPAVQAGPAPASRWPKTTSLPSVPGFWLSDDDGLTSFDASFFGIAEEEAKVLRPNARLALEVSWHALEDAGIVPSSLRGSRTGIYLASSGDEGFRKHVAHGGSHRFWGTSHSGATLAGRLARFYDVHGPVITLETACSGGMAALHQAVVDLTEGRADGAIVGGVTTHFEPEAFAFLHDAGLGSASGRCAGFGDEADGYAPSEGVVFCFLSRTDRAASVDARIRAVIECTTLQHDGRALGLTAPNSGSQARMLRDLLASCHLSPGEITAFEAHGTGTRLGDAMEAEALKSVFATSGRSAPDARPLLVTSAKSTVGHLEEAAGLMGLLRAVLCLEHGQIPPQHVASVNPELSLGDALQVPLSAVHFDAGELTRICVSSLGFSGTIGALILRSHRRGAGPESPPPPVKTPPPASAVLTLSANSVTSLARLAHHWAQLSSQAPGDFERLAAASNLHRAHLPLRWCATSASDLVDPDLSQVSSVRSPRLLIVLGDQGTPSGLVSAIISFSRTSQTFRAAIQKCLAQYRQARPDPEGDALPSLVETLHLFEPKSTLDVQRLVLAFQVAAVRMLAKWGLCADFVVGHSLGELGAAFASGALDLETLARLVTLRGQLMLSLPPGAMLSVDLSAERTSALVDGTNIAIAAVNEELRTVASGSLDAIDQLDAALQRQGISTRRLEARHAFHHPDIHKQLIPLASFPGSRAPSTKGPVWVSSYTARAMESTPSASFWLEQAARPVRFCQALRGAAGADAAGVLVIDASHKAGLTRTIERTLGHGVEVVPLATRQAQAEPSDILRRAHLAGCSINFSAVHEDTGGGLSSPPTYNGGLPTYPFERQFHWSVQERTVTPDAPHRVENPADSIRQAAARKGSSEVDVWRGEPASVLFSSLVRERLRWESSITLPLDKSLVDLGLDSLDLVSIHSRLRDEARCHIPLRELLGSASVRSVQEQIEGMALALDERPRKAPVLSGVQVVSDLIAKHSDTSTWPSPWAGKAPSHREVLLTGATGRLGASLAVRLAQDPLCHRVHCLVRGGGHTRILDAMDRFGHGRPTHLDKLVAWRVDTAAGLSSVLPKLKASVTQVVHLAWKLDFNEDLERYDACLEMTSKLAEFCFNRLQPIRMLFSSSVTAGGLWLGSRTPARLLPIDGRYAVQQGYGLSKHCAEHILATLAATDAAGDSTLCIARIGQICGDANGPPGSWPSTKMFPRLLSTMQTFGGIVPKELDKVDWIPIGCVVEALHRLTVTPTAQRLVHLSNPHPRSWKETLAVFGSAAGIRPQPVPLAKYIRVLHALASARVDVPSLALLPFFEGLEEGRTSRHPSLAITHLDTEGTRRCAPELLAACDPLSDDDILRGVAKTL